MAKRFQQRGRSTLVALLLTGLLFGCGTDESPTTRSSQPDASPSSTPLPTISLLKAPSEKSAAELIADSEEVSFTGGKGDQLTGRLYGDGDVGIVLAHGADPEAGQYDWLPVASALASMGYSVLTFNFTGFCPADHGLKSVGCSKGKLAPTETWRDIEPAVDFLREQGPETIFVFGSSMGGMATMHSAARTEVEVSGVVTLGAPDKAPPEFPQTMNLTDDIVEAVDEPKLFMAGSGDDGTPANAENMFKVASEQKKLEILDSSAHGSDLLIRSTPEISEKALSLLVDFVQENAP